MDEKTSKSANQDEWRRLLRQFKETLAQRVWSLAALAEAEKEVLFRHCLSDLEDVDKKLSAFQESVIAEQHLAKDENELLRSLLGLSTDDVKARSVAVGQDLELARRQIDSLHDEAVALKEKASLLQDENQVLRERLQELERGAHKKRVEELQSREQDVNFFSSAHQALKEQLTDLESRLANMKLLFKETNEKLLSEKQEEITLLQKKLLEQMEHVLKERQQLVRSEEEMFARGVVQRIRNALVAAQGQLFLTLERMGLLDPETKTEAFWKARLRLLVEGAGELSGNFQNIQRLLQEVGQVLDDYLHLTRREEITRTPVSLKEMVQADMAELYADRQPNLNFELLTDDPLPPVQADASLLRFIVKALLQNALESLSNRPGSIVVSMKNEKDRGHVELLVRDSGSGIPNHLADRLFEPFFTTKENHQGLSLSRARRYAELHNGTLQLVQTSPEGTVFQLQLPVTPRDGFQLSLGMPRIAQLGVSPAQHDAGGIDRSGGA